MAKVMMKSLIFGALVLTLLSTNVFAQTNPQFQHKDIVDTEFNFPRVNSAQMPTLIGPPKFGEMTFERMEGVEGYVFKYKPGKKEGNTKAVFEYWTVDSQTGELRPDYTTFTFRITRSLVSCGEDRRSTVKNQAVNGIPVLENDTRTHGPLILESISYVENGIATINGENIDFVPNVDFVGDAFVYYVARDSKDKVGTGTLKIRVLDPDNVGNYDVLDVVSYGGVEVEIDLPSSGFQLDNTVSNGQFTVDNGKYMYRPFGNLGSNEILEFSKDDIRRDVNISVVAREFPNSWVIDDIVYTSQGTPVIFDVEKNDLKQNQSITSHSAELQITDQSGVFSYQPESFFTGSKTFEYTVFNGYESETGAVHLKVNNFYPQKQYDYNFTALSNAALVIEYLVPIQNFSFELLESPANGTITLNTGTVLIDLGCTEIGGTNLVMYEPNANFQGHDAFRLNYCVDGQCEEVEIKVEVVQNNLDDCQCFTGCVWAGDANNDGLVNVVDLLSMAYSIGSSGAQSDWNGGSGWIGRSTEDWIYNSPDNVNAKFADADGNGKIDELDFESILENYDRNHALVPPQLLDNKSYPFTLTPLQDTVYIGDRIEFEIGLGSSDYPALDVHGIAFSLGLPSQLVDSSSVEMNYYNNSWLAVDEAVYGIHHQVSDGWIETAAARLGSQPQSGHGEIATVGFIVEEDLVGGFRVSDGLLPVTIRLQDGQALTGNFEMGSVKGDEATVYLNLSKKQSDSASESRLLAFPNPTSDQLNLHMNGGHEILNYQVFDLLGQRVLSKSNVELRNTSISTVGLNQGTYVVRANTSFGPQVLKFEVVNLR